MVTFPSPSHGGYGSPAPASPFSGGSPQPYSPVRRFSTPKLANRELSNVTVPTSNAPFTFTITSPRAGSEFNKRKISLSSPISSPPSQPIFRYTCEVEGCGEVFTRHYNLQLHVKSHGRDPEHPFFCTTDRCGERFPRETDLHEHRIVHIIEKRNTCDDCGRSVAREDTLTRCDCHESAINDSKHDTSSGRNPEHDAVSVEGASRAAIPGHNGTQDSAALQAGPDQKSQTFTSAKKPKVKKRVQKRTNTEKTVVGNEKASAECFQDIRLDDPNNVSKSGAKGEDSITANRTYILKQVRSSNTVLPHNVAETTKPEEVVVASGFQDARADETPMADVGERKRRPVSNDPMRADEHDSQFAPSSSEPMDVDSQPDMEPMREELTEDRILPSTTPGPESSPCDACYSSPNVGTGLDWTSIRSAEKLGEKEEERDHLDSIPSKPERRTSIYFRSTSCPHPQASAPRSSQRESTRSPVYGHYQSDNTMTRSQTYPHTTFSNVPSYYDSNGSQPVYHSPRSSTPGGYVTTSTHTRPQAYDYPENTYSNAYGHPGKKTTRNYTQCTYRHWEPEHVKRHHRGSYSYYPSPGSSYADGDEDEYIDVDGVSYVIPAKKVRKRAGPYQPVPASGGYGSDYYQPYAQSPHRRTGGQSSFAIPQRSQVAKPKEPPKPTKATEADAKKYKIPAGYSLKNWDPTEEPVLLLGSVFDANSLGKWIYDWAVYRHGPSTPISEMAGDLWLLLIQLSGKMKQTESQIPLVRLVENREVLEDFIESGERLMDKLRALLKRCEAPMLKVGGKGKQLSGNAGTTFVDTLFGRDCELDKTERFMQSVRLWNLRFDVNCAEIIKKPWTSSSVDGLQDSEQKEQIPTSSKKSSTAKANTEQTRASSIQSPQQDLQQHTELWATIVTPKSGYQDVRVKDDSRNFVSWIDPRLVQRFELSIEESAEIVTSIFSEETFKTTQMVRLEWFGKRKDEMYHEMFYVAPAIADIGLVLGDNFTQNNGSSLQICRSQKTGSPVDRDETSANEEHTSDGDETSDEDVVDTLAQDHPLFKEVPTLIQIMTKGFEGWRTCKGQSTTGKAAGKLPASSNSGKSSARQLKRNREGDEDYQSDNDDNASNRNQKRRNTDSGKDELLLLACPFYMHDKIRHQRCISLVLKRIKDVKQHLFRSHKQPTFCPRCGTILKDKHELSNHLRYQPCELRDFEAPGGLTEEQEEDLKSKVDRRLSLAEQWKSVYRILFPDQEPPESAFLQKPFQEGLLSFSEFLQEQGQTIISNYVRDYSRANSLRDGDGLDPEDDFDPNPERTRAALLETVARGAMLAVIEGYQNQLSANEESQDETPALGHSDNTTSGSGEQEPAVQADVHTPLFDLGLSKAGPSMSATEDAFSLDWSQINNDEYPWMPPFDGNFRDCG